MVWMLWILVIYFGSRFYFSLEVSASSDLRDAPDFVGVFGTDTAESEASPTMLH